MLLMNNKRGNRQVSKKNLLLLDKYVKKGKENKENKDKSGGDDKVSTQTESKT